MRELEMDFHNLKIQKIELLRINWDTQEVKNGKKIYWKNQCFGFFIGGPEKGRLCFEELKMAGAGLMRWSIVIEEFCNYGFPFDAIMLTIAKGSWNFNKNTYFRLHIFHVTKLVNKSSEVYVLC